MLTDEQRARIAAHAKDNPMPGTTARPLVAGQPLHVDGDYAAYYCSGNDDTSVGEARQKFLDKIRDAKHVSGSDRIIVHLSDRACDKGLRFLIAESRPYQGQRNTGRKPNNWEYLREFMETYSGDAFVVQNWKDREADDGMAYLAEQSYNIGRPGAVLTADKDMRMFAGLHIVWKTHQMVEIVPGTYERVFADKVYGHKWFWLQMLTGDQADNIPGLPRVGEVAAHKLLDGTENNQQAFERVIEMYKAKMGDAYPDYFVEQAALLWMRTGKTAPVHDFFLNLPFVEWTTDVARATKRLTQRVDEAQAALTAKAFSA